MHPMIKTPSLSIVVAATVLLTVGCIGSQQKEKQSATSPEPGRFYVATNGNDSWSGLLPVPALDGRDGPFRTLSNALAASRSHAAGQSGAGKLPPSIILRGGIYFLAEPVVLTPADSGLRLAAFENEEPVLSGGRPLQNWTLRRSDGREVWTAEVPEARGGQWLFRELWVNGQRAVRSRHPNRGYLPIAKILDKTSDWTKGHSRFEFKAGDLQAWPGITNGEALVMTRWVESRLPITSVDIEKRILTFGKRSVFELSDKDTYYMEGAPEFLDSPGEWYLDPAEGRLHYLPLPGQKPEATLAIAPVLAQVLRLEGLPDEGKHISEVFFEGITFSHSEWCFPEGFQSGKHKPTIWPEPDREVGGFAQAAIGVPGAVWGDGVRNCIFDRCRFLNLGTYAVELGRACAGNRFTRSEFAHLGAGGLKIGQTAMAASDAHLTRDNLVEDCHIYDGGLMFHSAIGVWIGQSPGNSLLHNHIHDFYYTGISAGWTWGYGPALATNTTVAFNHVHHIGVRSDGDGPILSDMAGIYTLGRHLGSSIHNNLWHDMAGIHYGGWGIYFDEGTTGISATSNVVYRTTHGGFHQHYGATNSVNNNIFAFAKEHQVQRSRVEPHVSFSFQTNIVYLSQGVLFGGNWAGDSYLVNQNMYFDTRSGTNAGDFRLGPCTWAEWHQRGHDTNSLLMDPLFVDPETGDFNLKENSPAGRIGFRPIDLRSVGPRHQ